MMPCTGGLAPVYELPDELVLVAAGTWCRARRLAQPSMPALHRLFSPLGLDMVVASFDSLLCLFECATGRPLAIGTRDRPTADQIALCAMLTRETARRSSRGRRGTEGGGLASAIECAASSVVRLAATSSDAMVT